MSVSKLQKYMKNMYRIKFNEIKIKLNNNNSFTNHC